MLLKFGNIESKSREEVDVGQIRSWIRRIEQNIDSIDKRLDAVERRLSGEIFTSPKILKNESKSNSEVLDRKIQELSQKLDEEIRNMREEMLRFGRVGDRTYFAGENRSRRGPVVISHSSKGKEGLTDEQEHAKEIAELERRIERMEKRKTTVKVGRVEIPIEITGIVGGIFAFIIAALLFEGYKNIVTSPVFCMLAGAVLVSAAALKTYLINKNEKV
ncbi:MAG: hypothetical protein J7J34_00785 [Thermoplasmata archaeon]|nr:hypothetical protein [Thermoplasmata archaeon]